MKRAYIIVALLLLAFGSGCKKTSLKGTAGAGELIPPKVDPVAAQQPPPAAPKPTTPTPQPAAPATKPATAADKAEDKAEDKTDNSTRPAELVADKGIKNLLMPGLQRPLDVMLGMELSALASPLGIELGEPGAKVKKPARFKVVGHKFTGDGAGKLKQVSFALVDIPGGLQVANGVLTPDLKLDQVAELVGDCKVVKRRRRVSCAQGKLIIARVKGKVVFQLGGK